MSIDLPRHVHGQIVTRDHITDQYRHGTPGTGYQQPYSVQVQKMILATERTCYMWGLHDGHYWNIMMKSLIFKPTNRDTVKTTT